MQRETNRALKAGWYCVIRHGDNMSKLKGFEPFVDLVIVERDKPEEVTASGFILPTVAQLEVDQGTIVAIGAGKISDQGVFIPVTAKVGDQVIYSKYANLEFKYRGKEYVSMHEADLLGRLTE